MQHQDEVLTSDEFGISWLVKPNDMVSFVVPEKKKGIQQLAKKYNSFNQSSDQ
jgi:hypothetical protein